MADKKQNRPIVIKVFETCTGEAKRVIVSTVYNHRLLRRGYAPFAREKHIKLKSTNKIQH